MSEPFALSAATPSQRPLGAGVGRVRPAFALVGWACLGALVWAAPGASQVGEPIGTQVAEPDAASTAGAQRIGPATLRPDTPLPDPTSEDPEALERAAAAREAQSAALSARADAVRAEVARLRVDLVDAGRRIAVTERRIAAMEDALAATAREEEVLVERLRAERDGFGEALSALQRLERARPPSIATTRGDAVAAARAAALTREITAALETRIDRTRTDISSLLAVRGRMLTERDAVVAQDARLTQERTELASLVDEKRALESTLRADAAAAADAASALAAQATSLRELIAALTRQAERAAPPLRPDTGERQIPSPRLRPDPSTVTAAPPAFVAQTGRFADARGLLSAPVAGALIAGFGEANAASTREGVVFRTRRGAQVSSPYDARIEFAGNFLGYGRLLILNVGDGYHLILAGMEVVYGAVGDVVLAGEPLGVMANRRRPSPQLYFELRKDGEPIDPAPWLRA